MFLTIYKMMYNVYLKQLRNYRLLLYLLKEHASSFTLQSKQITNIIVVIEWRKEGVVVGYTR